MQWQFWMNTHHESTELAVPISFTNANNNIIYCYFNNKQWESVLFVENRYHFERHFQKIIKSVYLVTVIQKSNNVYPFDITIDSYKLTPILYSNFRKEISDCWIYSKYINRLPLQRFFFSRLLHILSMDFIEWFWIWEYV